MYNAISSYVCVYIYIYLSLSLYTYIYIYVQCVCVCVHIYIYIYMYQGHGNHVCRNHVGRFTRTGCAGMLAQVRGVGTSKNMQLYFISDNFLVVQPVHLHHHTLAARARKSANMASVLPRHYASTPRSAQASTCATTATIAPSGSQGEPLV